MKTKIIHYIQKNKISSVEVSDALAKSGVLDRLTPINDGQFVVGEVEYVYTCHNSNWDLHKQIENIKENRIVFVDTFDCDNRAVLGDIVSKYLLLYKHAKAIVINGLVRDVHRLKKENYPIWSLGSTPLGCYNKEVQIDYVLQKKIDERKRTFQDAILVADDSGCALIENKLINQELYEKLEFIELQEDIWYFCIDTLKMSTYETICLKQYLDHDREILPTVLKEKLHNFENTFKELRK